MGNLIYELSQQKNSNESLKVDFSNQPNGIYYVKIKTTDGIVTNKIVLIR
ncbi:MAG: T9SS type A sorting domain-containing protein [Cytophagales bacterium]|nr:T9SS type A sorting domain-containing protein [Cytophagales bacterium]